MCDLVRILVIEDIDLAIDGLLFAEELYHVAGTQVHGDWIAAGSDFVVEALDFREDLRETIPLSFVSLAAFGYGNGVFKSGVVIP